jgi:phosphoglycolate phosphatase-like HAD superfamily hydrolase
MDGFDLIIFDCDGVLVDSEIIAAEVESRLLTEAGYPIGAEEMGERFAGMTWHNILLTIEREASIPLSATLLDKSEKLLDARLAADVQVIDGVKRMLSRIRKPYCICSNSASHRLDMMLSKVGLKEIFAPHIYSAKDLGPDRQAEAGHLPARRKAVQRRSGQHAGHRGFGAWHCRGTGCRHARGRLHRRLAQLSLPCRPADGSGRRNSHFAHERTA